MCGAGVSLASTDGAAPSWSELIGSGIKRAAGLDPNAEAWAAAQLNAIKTTSSDSWISIADEMASRLGGAENAEFANWLSDTFSALRATRLDLIDAIFSLGCPVATTNYDTILEDASGLTPISWDEHSDVLNFLSGKKDGILHIHGVWNRPRSVVLGRGSYNEQIKDQRHTLSQAIATLERPTILIGCGEAGLTDPDFQRLDALVDTWQDSAPRRYWMVRGTSSATDRTSLPSPDHKRRLYPILYGSSFSDLSTFLSTRIKSSTPIADQGAFRSIDLTEPCPLIFGRKDQINTIVRALANSQAVIISGGPGMGKTATSVAAMYTPEIREIFGERRAFVSLETVKDSRDMLARLAEGVGSAASGDSASLIHLIKLRTSSAPTVVVLDNAETVFSSNRLDAERQLRLLAQIPNLQLVINLRGTPPILPSAIVISDLPKLDSEASKAAFLAVAGDRFEADPDLDAVLKALDGHALSIQLMAALALDLPSLRGLRDRWNTAHAAILRRPGEEEGRLTSLRASLALSLQTPTLAHSPLARRLLSVLAFLPAGLSEDSVRKILGDLGAVSRDRAIEAVDCLHQLRLIERRADTRLRMLNPLRESIKVDVNIQPSDRRRLIRHYLSIARAGNDIGTSRWERARDEIFPEADNLDSICSLAIDSGYRGEDIESALGGLHDLHEFGGITTVNSAQVAAALPVDDRSISLVQNAEFQLGRSLYVQGEYDSAKEHLNRVIFLSPRAKARNPAANAKLNLAQLSLIIGDLAASEAQLKDALMTYEEIGNIQGIANVRANLARVWIGRSDFAAAVAELEAAENLYTRLGDRVGVANCLSSKSDMAFFAGRFSESLGYIEQVLEIVRQVGGLLSEANAYTRRVHVRSWEDLSFSNSSDCVLAENIFHKRGSASGLAFLYRTWAELDFRSGHHEQADSKLGLAIDFYNRSGSRLSVHETTLQRRWLNTLCRPLPAPQSELSGLIQKCLLFYDKLDRSREGLELLAAAFSAPTHEERLNLYYRAVESWNAAGRADLGKYWHENRFTSYSIGAAS